MTKESRGGLGIDEGAYKDAGIQFEQVKSRLPRDAVEAVAEEVVKRLAFRFPHRRRGDRMPHQGEIEQLCRALLADDEVAADRIIAAARKGGAGVDVIYLGFIAGAARALGRWWQEDRISFAEVTMACGRLFRIIRALRHDIDSVIVTHATRRHVMLALVPGETHSLGLHMAADLLGNDGWDVDISVGEDFDTAMGRTELARYSSVVLVANSERRMADLVRMALALRITQPMAHLIVAGDILNLVEDVERLTGADAAIFDLSTAVAQLRSIISEGSTPGR